MVVRALRSKQEDALKNGVAPAGLKIIIQQLIKQATSRDNPPKNQENNGELQEIIFDIEMDGMRYQLVRSQVRSSQEYVVLSPREQEIARMIAEGYPNKTIAAVLDISSWTVCTHLRRVFAKLGVRSRAAMVAKLFEDNSFKK